MSLRHFKKLMNSPKIEDTFVEKQVCLSIIVNPCCNVEVIDEQSNTLEQADFIINKTNSFPELVLESQIPNVFDLVNIIPCAKVPTVRDKLQQWVLESNTSKNNVNKLLKVLQSEGLDLLLNVRTLMNTLRSHTIVKMPPGTYIHLGLEKMLLSFLNVHQQLLENYNEINISVNIDGLLLANSLKQQFWPILCSIVNVPQLSQLVFAIGIYYSNKKRSQSLLNNF